MVFYTPLFLGWTVPVAPWLQSRQLSNKTMSAIIPFDLRTSLIRRCHTYLHHHSSSIATIFRSIFHCLSEQEVRGQKIQFRVPILTCHWRTASKKQDLNKIWPDWKSPFSIWHFIQSKRSNLKASSTEINKTFRLTRKELFMILTVT